MVITSQNNRSCDLAAADGLVECEGDLRAAFAVSIEDAGLRADNQIVASCLFDPSDVVHHLALDLLRSLCHDLSKHFRRNGV